MIRSMTAYASRTGAHGATRWSWEMRGVNGRGLDLKLRLPDGVDGLEAAIRAAVKPVLQRGVINLTLRLPKDDQAQSLALDEGQLGRVLAALDEVQDRAFAMGVTLNQPSTADVLATRGVIAAEQSNDGPDAELIEALKLDFETLLADFVAMREAEGAALASVLTNQLSQVSNLVDQAQTLLSDRSEASKAQMKAALSRVMEEVKDADPDRLTQELALIAVKQDVTEEVDRLRTHVAAAQSMMTSSAPIGRKFDFLSQEFNREANTLCAKSQFAPLTAIGLELKAVIDQMREQIQNVE